MYLLELSMSQFRQFIQLVLWISLPLIAICLVVTTLLHYRRRKKGKLKNSGTDTIMCDISVAETVQPMLSNNTKITGTEAILKQYEQQLLKGKEKYQTLEKSFRVLQENYSAVISRLNDEGGIDKDEMQALLEKVKGYELKVAQQEQALTYIKDQNNEDKVVSDTSAAMEERNLAIAEREHSITKLTEKLNALRLENNQLRNKSTITSNDDQLQLLNEKFCKAEAENLALKNSLPHLKSLEDMVGEKNLQINFLQQQLDQRIKQHHELEHEQNLLNDSKTSLQNELLKSQEQLHNQELQILARQSELDEWQVSVNELTRKNNQLEKMISDKQLELNNIAGEQMSIQNKYSELQTALNEKAGHITRLEEDLSAAKEKAQSFEIKWEQTSQVISRIYRELSVSVDDQMMVSSAGTIVNSVNEEALT